LNLAASIALASNTGTVTNLTGHKLIPGYPEGRRMWLNMADDVGRAGASMAVPRLGRTAPGARDGRDRQERDDGAGRCQRR
jgi:hypothetical protein